MQDAKNVIRNICSKVGFIYTGRFVVGFVGGSACIVLAMYSNEVCSDLIRGRSGAFYDMMQVLGILYVYIMTATNNLYWASILCMLVPMVFLCAFYWMPESPLYLIKHGHKAEAVKCIRFVSILVPHNYDKIGKNMRLFFSNMRKYASVLPSTGANYVF